MDMKQLNNYVCNLKGKVKHLTTIIKVMMKMMFLKMMYLLSLIIVSTIKNSVCMKTQND